jgi:hypothetical protein
MDGFREPGCDLMPVGSASDGRWRGRARGEDVGGEPPYGGEAIVAAAVVEGDGGGWCGEGGRRTLLAQMRSSTSEVRACKCEGQVRRVTCEYTSRLRASAPHVTKHVHDRLGVLRITGYTSTRL